MFIYTYGTLSSSSCSFPTLLSPPLPSSPISPYSIASQSPTTKNRQQQRNVIRLPTFKGQFEDGPGFPLALAATATAADVVTKRKQEKRIREKGDKKKSHHWRGNGLASASAFSPLVVAHHSPCICCIVKWKETTPVSFFLMRTFTQVRR